MIHQELNPRIFDEKDKMREPIREALLKIVQEFLTKLNQNEIPISVVDYRLVGSNAAYNYSPKSDMDIHIIADLSSFRENEKLLQLVYDYFKANFNDKYDIKIKGMDVELYIEDASKGSISNGVYSIKEDEWVKKPKHTTVLDFDVEKSQQYKDLVKQYQELKDDEINDFIDMLYVIRKISLSKSGEFGEGNLIFKAFRDNGYLDDLRTRQAEIKSRELSLESLQEAVSPQGYTPKKTGKAYKVFKVKNGKLYPPMVANSGGKDTPVGVWLDAEEGEFAGLSKTGRPKVKSTGGEPLAYRPGWHLGDIPRAKQFDRLNKETGEYEFPKDFVWAECDYAMDVDYQPESDAQGYMRTKMDDQGNVVTYKSDKYQHSLAGLPKLPKDGYYKYRTNPNPDTVPWVITGQMKVNRLLSDDEVNAILKKNGIAPIHRQGGDKTLGELGLQESLQEELITESKADIEKFKKWAGEDLANRFFQLKDRLTGKEKDIYYWMGLDKVRGHNGAISELSMTLRYLEKIPTNKERKQLARGGSEKVYDDSNWLVLKIDTYEASEKYGKNTTWCLSGDNEDGRYFFADYSDHNDIYFYIDKKENKKYALTFDNLDNWTLWTEWDFPICGKGSQFEWNSSDEDIEFYKNELFDRFKSDHPDFPNVKGLPDINETWDELLYELDNQVDDGEDDDDFDWSEADNSTSNNRINEAVTPSQEEYFKNSKVRDKDGNLLVVYHGTLAPGFKEFGANKGKSQFGKYKFGKYNVNYFTTDKASAASYTELGVERDGNVYACYLNIENPFIVDNKVESDIKSAFNIQDDRIRKKQLEAFERLFRKWEGKIIDTDDSRLNDLNRDLHKFNLELRPSYEYDDDDFCEYFDLYNLGKNSFWGAENCLFREYPIDELFSDDMYDELKEAIVGEDENDYLFSTDDIVRYVIAMNEEDGTNYDGIIISDIIDSKSVFSDITTDYITLKSPNQIKLISNANPTSSNRIDEASIVDKIKLEPEQDRRRKLSDEDKEEIRRLYATGFHSLNSLAKQFGVSKKLILLIVNPESKAKNDERIKNHWRDYYDTQEHTSAMRDTRAYKKDLLDKGELKKIEEVYPNKGESKKDFIARFMSVTKDEYPDQKQRYAVANSYWDRRNKKRVNESKESSLVVYTYQPVSVKHRLQDGKVYIANFNNTPYNKEYRELASLLGLSNCPIFAALSIEDLNKMMNSSFISTNGRVLIKLNVPRMEMHFMEYYDWTDYMYDINSPGELDISRKELENLIATQRLESEYDECQVVLDRIEPSWLVEDDRVNEDINQEMSNEYDSEGNQLTKAQAEFFKNSKIRDEQGRLLVVYHGTPNKFDTFDKGKIGTGNGCATFGYGFYFSRDEWLAKEYSDNISKYYLNITHPFDYYAEPSDIKEMIVKSGFDYDISKLDDEYYYNYHLDTIYDYIGAIINEGENPYRVFTDMVISAEFDGIVADDDELEIVAFEPNQIKSITNLNPTNRDNINESLNEEDKNVAGVSKTPKKAYDSVKAHQKQASMNRSSRASIKNLCKAMGISDIVDANSLSVHHIDDSKNELGLKNNDLDNLWFIKAKDPKDRETVHKVLHFMLRNKVSYEKLYDTLNSIELYHYDKATDSLVKRNLRSFNEALAKSSKGRLDEATLMHWGDLDYGRKADRRAIMAGRGTGHFGTGFYFVSKDKYDDMHYDYHPDRPIYELDTDSYKLFKPKSVDDAYALHDALKTLNDYAREDNVEVLGYLDKRDEMHRDLNKLEDRIGYEDGWDNDVLEFTKKYGAPWLVDRVEYMIQAKNWYDLERFPKQLYDSYIESHNEVRDAIRTIEKITRVYKDLESIVPKAASHLDAEDSISTEVMKALGFEGIDVSHLQDENGWQSPDNFKYGSVVYDLKPGTYRRAHEPRGDYSLKYKK